MMKKLKVLLLAGNTLRARAYAQYLANTNLNIEIKGLMYGFQTRQCSIPELNIETQHYLKSNHLFIPNFKKSLQNTFQANSWNYTEIETDDVNSIEIVNRIKQTNCDIVVFAGYGGQLLKEQHFLSNKKYLHMHPGKLPIERGSTTLYYSILNQRKLTVTAFYMTDKIDDGENILFKEYNIPQKNVDIDRWIDNVVRANCFVEALGAIIANKKLNESLNEDSQEYYVIHPVLKHLSLLSLK